MGYLKPKTSPVGRGMVCWATLFYCLFKSYYYLIPKTPHSNHTAPLPTGEGLGVGLLLFKTLFKLLHKLIRLLLCQAQRRKQTQDVGRSASREAMLLVDES